jgi:hypothetical protein
MMLNIKQKSSIILLCSIWALLLEIIKAQSCDTTNPYPRHCVDETCGVPLLNYSDSAEAIPCACTDADIGHKFSPCSNGTKTLYYYWYPPATCLNETLPLPITGINCNLTCPAGQYFNIMNLVCQPCDNGTFSVQGLVFSQFNKFPPQFNTLCTIINSNQPCAAWNTYGDYMDSGNNFNINNINSVLTLTVKITEFNGSVRFYYKVLAEPGYDGLSFYIDEASSLVPSRVSTQSDFTPFVVNLKHGYHILKWVYSKDASLSRGLDRAYLRNIQVSGTTGADLICQACAPGTFSQGGSSNCTLCPNATYADQYSSANCTACRPGEIAFPGSTKCIATYPCDPSDYVATTTPCVNGQHNVSVNYFVPTLCNPVGSVQPYNYTENCPPPICPNGQQLVGSACAYCNPGSASSSGGACTPCLSGTAAHTRINYINSFWGNWPPGMSSSCTGDCGSVKQWRLGFNFTDSGPLHAPGSVSSLILTQNYTEFGWLNYTYALSCDSSSAQFLFYINGNLSDSYDCIDGCNVVFRQISRRIPPRSSTFTWSYVKRTVGNNNSHYCDRAIISSIALSGVDNGGSPLCDTCIPGYVSSNNAATCSPCQPGQFSSPAGSQCLPCGNGNFSYAPASFQCLQCGAGTTSLLVSFNFFCNFNSLYVILPYFLAEWLY